MCISKGELKENTVLISVTVPQGLSVLNAHLGCLKGRSRRLHCSSELSDFGQAFIFFPLNKLNFTSVSLALCYQAAENRDPIISALQTQLSGVRQVQAFFALRRRREQAEVLNRNL